MRMLLPVVALLALSVPVRAQLSEGGTPPSFTHAKAPAAARMRAALPGATPPAYVKLPVDFDVAQLKAQDAADEAMGLPLNMARDIPVDLAMSNSGVWSTLANGQRIWQLTVEAPGALATMIYYDEFRLPPGGRLFIYNPQRTKILGAFTAASNPVGGKFATELLAGDTFTLEYVAPDGGGAEAGQPSIRIEAVAYGYNNITTYPEVREESYGDALDCQVNTACSEGDSWRDQINGVVRISFRKTSNSTSWCSGAILNNVRQDFTPYLLTACHCVDESDSLALLQTVVYFHYQYASCGDTESTASEPTSPQVKTLTGAQLLDTTPQTGGSDGALLKLTQSIPVDYNAYYNGWSVNGVTPTSGVGIHHPRGDVKKISTFTAPAKSGTYTGSKPGAADAHWLVEYKRTANGYSRTESGSSGSALFDQNKRVVGTLSGSNSTSYPCDGSNGDKAGTAWYGKLSYHWDKHGNNPAKFQMKPYLDPDATGTLTMEGSYNTPTYTVTFAVKDASNANIADAVVTFNGVTNAAGSYTFSGIAAGTYNYTVARSGYVTASGSLTVSAANFTKDVVLQLTPPPTYTVTFAVKDASNANVADAVVTFNGVTNVANNYTFSGIAAGTYNYTVAKLGYDTVRSSLTVSTANLTNDVVLQLTPPPTYTVTFAVKDASNANVANAVVTFNDVTNVANNYTFSGIAAGTYNYTVAKSGYNTASGSLTVNTANLTKDVILQLTPPPTHTVTFVVKDANNANVANAVVTFNGVTNVANSYTFSGIASGTYSYTVVKSGYVTASDSLTVGTADLTEEVALRLVPPPAYTATFAVTDVQGTPITDAVVTFNGVANAAGSYTFSGVAAGTYNYTVVKSGYVTASGSLTVGTADLTEEVALRLAPPPAYTATFAVTDVQGTPITDAVVTFNGVANAAGNYTFSNVAAGRYGYRIAKSGYATTSDSLTVNGNLVINEVLYAFSGVAKSGSKETLSAKVFPNPVLGGLLHVALGEDVSLVEVDIYTLTGELCLSQTFRASSFSIDISKCPAGALLVKLLEGGKYAVKPVVKTEN